MADHVATPVTGISREPAVVIATIGAFVAALITLLVAFGADITEEQRNAILGMVGPTVLFIILVGVLIRRKVSPASTVVVQTGPNGRLLAGAAATTTTGYPVPAEEPLGSLVTIDDDIEDAPGRANGFV